MSKEIFVIKIRNTEGVVVGEIALEEPDSRASSAKERTPLFRQYGGEDTDSKPITDAQRRMMFRLALKLGHQGDEARKFIEGRLAAYGNGKPDRKTASALIDKLQIETGNGNARGGRHVAA